jgi:hypothetical protein
MIESIRQNNYLIIKGKEVDQGFKSLKMMLITDGNNHKICKRKLENMYKIMNKELKT